MRCVCIVILFSCLQIQWEKRLNEPIATHGPLTGATFLVDVTIFPVHGFEAKDPHWKDFYSAKHKLHCWKFTGAHKLYLSNILGIISAFGGYFVYFSPQGFPGKTHDKHMWDLEKIAEMLQDDEFGLADKGYEGVTKLLTPWKGKSLDQKQK